MAMVMSRIARHCLTRRRHLNTRRVAVATIQRATANVVLRAFAFAITCCEMVALPTLASARRSHHYPPPAPRRLFNDGTNRSFEALESRCHRSERQAVYHPRVVTNGSTTIPAGHYFSNESVTVEAKF